MSRNAHNFIDLTGKQFGSWIVISPKRVPYLNTFLVKWLCRCKCNIEKYINPDSLKTGASQSCGGYFCKPGRIFEKNKNYKNVLCTNVNKIANGYRIEFKCECGILFNKGYKSAEQTKILKCKNCLGKDISKRFKKPDRAFNIIYNRYKQGAKSRNIKFELSREEIKILIKQNCDYCNQIPNNRLKTRIDIIFYNGIDRFDNSLGYIKNNVKTCCKRCNLMKGNISLELIKKLATYL